MITIIEAGTKKKVRCYECGALLGYDEKEDVKYEEVKQIPANCVGGFKTKRPFITCPQCNYKIFIKTLR